MTAMTLGAPIFSTSRVLIGQVAVFMQWENESALENYLEQDSFGRILAKVGIYVCPLSENGESLADLNYQMIKTN